MPATMFMVSRRVSVIGRMMKVDSASRIAMIGTMKIGTPGSTVAFLKNLKPCLRIPA